MKHRAALSVILTGVIGLGFGALISHPTVWGYGSAAGQPAVWDASLITPPAAHDAHQVSAVFHDQTVSLDQSSSTNRASWGIDHSTPLMLPRLEYVGATQPADPWLSVTNVGEVAGQPVLVVFGDDDPAGCGGPLKSECGGLLMPGASWHFVGAQIPTRSANGIVYSFSVEATVARDPEGQPLGPSPFGPVLCDRVFYRAVGNCDRFRDFHAAYMSGGNWMGIDLSEAAGPPMTASVLRTWSVDLTPGATSASAYQGIPAVQLEPDADGSFRNWVIAGPSGGLAVQNAGTAASVVRVLQSTDVGPIQCGEARLEVGRAAAFDLSETCSGGDSEPLTVESDQPVAILVDDTGEWMLTTDPGFVQGPTQPPAARLAAPILLPAAGTFATVTVTVLNVGDQAVTVEAVLHDESGQVIDTVAEAACPGCVRRLPLDGPSDPMGEVSTGFVTVTSTTPGAKLRAAVELEEGEPGRVQRRGRVGLGDGAGSQRWVVPLALDALRLLRMRSELAITNYSDAVRADVRVQALDRNDTANVQCLSLGPSESARIDASALNLAGRATAYVVEVVDQSPEPGPGGTPAIGVTAGWLFNTTRGVDVPGDELALMAGVPVADAIPIPGPAVADCAPDFEPALRPNPEPALERAAGGVVFTPQAHFLQGEEQCIAHLGFTNDGDAPIRVLSVVWGETGFCPPQCAGPLAVETVGPIEPGQTLTQPFGTTGVQSAVHYALADISAGDAGVEPGSLRPLAEVLRERVGQAVVGDCRDFDVFHRAYLLGDTFMGMPLDQVHGGHLGVTVTRECPDVEVPQITTSSTYPGIPGVGLDATQQTGGAWVTSVVPIELDPEEARTTLLHLQNAGDLCAAVTIEFIRHGFGAGDSCPILAVSPGETLELDVGWCVPDGFRGYAVLTSTEPLAVVVEVIEPDRRRAARSWPTWNPFDLNGDGKVNEADGALLGAALGSEPGDPNWDPRYDLNADRRIDLLDLAFLRENYDEALRPTPTSTPVPTRHPSQTPTPSRTTTQTPSPPIVDTPSAEPPSAIFLPYAEVPTR